jgi:hypothetical protein
MPNFTQGSTRVVLQQSDLTSQNNGSIVLDSRRTRPLWFDGRFLAAKDLEREQDYFLQRQADLGQAGGFGVMHGLYVSQPPTTGPVSDAETIVIQAGGGITPAGELVMIPNDLTIQLSDLAEEENLGLQFGISTMPQQPPRTRTGLYIIALRPVEFTANPITSYPTSIQGSRTTHDGDIVEATAVSLVPYPNAINTSDPNQQRALLAYQIFLNGNTGTLSDSLLPLAVVSLQRGAINWIDPYLVRRDSGPEYSGVRFGLADPATQQAYLLQYNTQLQAVVATRQSNGLAANFAATDYFDAIPSAGPFPIAAISTKDFSQLFFPPQMDVRLSIIPSDELPALVEDSMSLPPIDLTLSADSYANLSVFALIPVPRNMLASLQATLPVTPLLPTLPQVIANRSPLQLLQLFQGAVTIAPPAPALNSAWANAIGTQMYGFYVRRRSQAIYVDFTSVALTSSRNPIAFGNSVTFTATVRPAGATGTIQFNDGINPIGGPVTLNNSAASVVATGLAVGAHPITAVYSGDDNNAASTSATLNEIVSDASVSVTSSTDPSILGQTVTFTAVVSPNTAKGNVQFLDGAKALGSPVSLTGSSATLTVPSAGINSLTIGAHSITADYSGDVNNAPAFSTPVTQTVNQAPSSVALVSSLNPATAEQGVTFTATVTGSVTGVAPTGTVQFKDLANPIGNPPLSGGLATLTISTLAPGAHPIAAVYSGDANYLSSTSPVVTETINVITPGVVVSSQPNPSVFQSPVTLTAVVSPASATGTVQFKDGANNLGAAEPLTGGRAQLSLNTLSVGSHAITAVYSGDANDAAGTSQPTTQTVNPLPTTVTLSGAPNPAQVGTTVSYTATILPNTATGSVQFFDGAASLGSAPLASATATLKVSTLAVGSHIITAAYSGDTNDAPSKSAPLAQTIVQQTTTTQLISSQNPSSVGQAVKLTATVTPNSVSGSIEFEDGGTSLGTASLSGGSTSITLTSLALGTHNITAVYSGDANDATSTSAALPQQVNLAASTVALVSSLDPSPFNAAVTFTATVTPGSATGTIQFKDGTANLGAAVPVSVGKASMPANNLSVGAHSITAVYSGDAGNSPSTSNTVTQTVTQAASTVAVASSAASVQFGQNVTFTATVSPASATGSVQFKDGATVLGAGSLTAGKATFSTSTLAVGSHTITAVYLGDTDFLTSTSAPLTQTIIQTPTSVVVTSGQNPSTVGQAVTFTAKVTPNTATGSVQFLDGPAIVVGSATLSGGIASLTDPGLTTAGTHNITAAYQGDANNARSTSPVLAQNVLKAPSTTSVTASPSVTTVGQGPVAFAVSITPATATGTVTLTEGANQLAPATALTGGSVSISVTLPFGIHTITANYSGDSNLQNSSGTVTATVNKEATTVTVTSTPVSVAPGTIFTATVNPKNATGTVTFTDSLGAPPLTSGPVNLTGGVATWSVIVPVPSQTITAVYSGDANFLGSTGTIKVGG